MEQLTVDDFAPQVASALADRGHDVGLDEIAQRVSLAACSAALRRAWEARTAAPEFMQRA